jgi:hypothetical protein
VAAQAQAGEPGSLAALYRTDFAVPDAPAFKLLDVDPTIIVRPTSVKELTGIISDFAGSGSTLTIPRAFALEIAPALLIAGKSLTIKKYNENPALYRIRFSAATRRPAEGTSPTEIALGLRVTLLDEADLRTNYTYMKSATAIAEQVNRVYEQARERVGPRQPLQLSSEETDSIGRLQAPLRELWENTKWNARVLELSAGFRAATPDPGGRNLRSNEFGGWGTFGTGFGSWGQLLIGVNAFAARDSVTADFSATAGTGARFYAGTNQYKFFAELGGEWKVGDDEWLLSGGGEAELIHGGWVSFSAGLATGGGTTNLRTNLALKLGVGGL